MSTINRSRTGLVCLAGRPMRICRSRPRGSRLKAGEDRARIQTFFLCGFKGAQSAPHGLGAAHAKAPHTETPVLRAAFIRSELAEMILWLAPYIRGCWLRHARVLTRKQLDSVSGWVWSLAANDPAIPAVVAVEALKR
jgi:hypothetical protein